MNAPTASRRHAVLLALVATWAAGCTGGLFVADSNWRTFGEASESCVVARTPETLSSDSASAAATTRPISVYASDPDVARALRAQPLFRLDCSGNPVAGLAHQWKYDAGRRAMLFRGESGDTRVDSLLATRLDSMTDTDGNTVDSVGWFDDSIAFFVAEDAKVRGPSSIYREVRDTGVSGDFSFASEPADIRDLIDSDVDVVVTRERRVIDYARRDPDRAIVPLEWDRAYLVLAPDGITLAVDDILDIADNVINADVLKPTPESSFADCRQRPTVLSVRPEDARVVFDSSDVVARDIADRIVSLATRGLVGAAPLPGLVATGVSRTELTERIISGADYYFVASIRSRLANICTELQPDGDAAWLFGERFVYVGSTREHVIVSGSGIEVLLDSSKMPYLRRAGPGTI